MTLGDKAGDVNQSGLPELLLRRQVHLRHVTDRALACGDLQAALLCNEMGHQTYRVGDLMLLQDTGDLPAARPYIEQALAIAERNLGANYPNTRIWRRNLEELLGQMGTIVAPRA